MTKKTKAYFNIHLAVFLFGFTAILGKALTLPESTIVWWRMILTVLGLLVIPGVIKKIREIPVKSILKLMGIGTVVALHWILFFGAVKFSNVSVTLSCIATATFFTAILEPIIRKSKIKWFEVFLGLLVIPGVYIIFRFTEFYAIGIAMALASAFLAAVFSILNKEMVDKYDPVAITFVELGSGWAAITPLVYLYYLYFPDKPFMPSNGYDVLYLCLLAFLCTSFAYVITLKALKELTSFTINLTINLEPIYGIVMAFLIFQENKELAVEFYIGAGIIMASVFLHPLLDKYFSSSVAKKEE